MYNKIPIEIKPTGFSFNSNDTRFTKVSILLMHLGVNLNHSVFSKESVVNAMPTLKNIPILGYIENGDFSDHREELFIVEDSNGESVLDIKYKGVAYGVIPENNNHRFETHKGHDGVEREYLVVDGILWSKLEGNSILEKDGIKSQSMEICEVEGSFESDGLYHITSFKFEGACILGNDVPPAMIDASITKKENTEYNYNFNGEKVQDIINKKLCVFNKLNKKNKEGFALSNKNEENSKITYQVDAETIIKEKVKEIEKLEGEKENFTEKINKLEKDLSELNKEYNLKCESYSELKNNYDQLENNYTILKNEVELSAKKEVVNEFSKHLSDVETFKEFELEETLNKYSVEDLRKELTLLLGTKAFNLSEKNTQEKKQKDNDDKIAMFVKDDFSKKETSGNSLLDMYNNN